MREVFVPTGIAAQPLRRPIILVAVWLVVLQSFLAGVATAQADAMLASNPIAAAIICHGGGGDDDSSAPDAGKVWHLCCTYCAAPGFAPPSAPRISVPDARKDALPPVLAGFAAVIVRAAVRAGSSQAPPSQA
jgi:hypothetical protein